MATLICAATAKELASLNPVLFPNADAIPEMQPLAGKLKNQDAVYLVTGVGPINAALAIGYCLGVCFDGQSGRNRIDKILCAGLAGSFDLDIAPLLSIWQVTEEIWPEYGLNDGMRVTARAFSYPLWSRAGGEDVYDRISLAGLSAFDCDGKCPASQWRRGASLTVAGSTASFNRRESLWNYWKAPLENMEGFAIAYAAARAGIPCVEVRVVSNKAGPRGKYEKDFPGALKCMEQILPDLNFL